MFHPKQQESEDIKGNQSEEASAIAQKSADLRIKFIQLQENIGALKRLLIRAANYSAKYQDFFKKLDNKLDKINRDCLQKNKDARNLYQSVKKEKGIELGKKSGEYTFEDQLIKNNSSYQIQRKILQKMVGVLNKELKKKIKPFTSAENFVEMLNECSDEHHESRVLVVILKFIFEHLDIDDVNLKKIHPKLSEDTLLAFKKIKIITEQNTFYGFTALHGFLQEENIACEWDPLSNQINLDEMGEKECEAADSLQIRYGSRKTEKTEKEKEGGQSKLMVREEIAQEILDPCIVRKFEEPLKVHSLYLEELEKKLININLNELQTLIYRLGVMREDICNGVAKEYAPKEIIFLEAICQLISTQCLLLTINKKLHHKEWHINEKDLRALLKNHKPRNNSISASISISDFPSVLPEPVEVIFNKQLHAIKVERGIKTNDDKNTSRYSRYFVPSLDMRFPRSKSDDRDIRLRKKSKEKAKTSEKDDKANKDHKDSLIENTRHQKKKPPPRPLNKMRSYDFFTKKTVPEKPKPISGELNMPRNN